MVNPKKIVRISFDERRKQIRIKQKGKKAKYFTPRYWDEGKSIAKKFVERILSNLKSYGVDVGCLWVKRRYLAFYCPSCERLWEEKKGKGLEIKLMDRDGYKRHIKVEDHELLKVCPYCNSPLKIMDWYMDDIVWVVYLPLDRKFSKLYPGLMDVDALILITYEGASYEAGRLNPIIYWNVLTKSKFEKEIEEISKFARDVISEPYRKSFRLRDVDKYFEEIFKDIRRMEEVEVEDVSTLSIPTPAQVQQPPPKKTIEKKPITKKVEKEIEKKVDISKVPVDEIRKEIEAYKISGKRKFEVDAFLMKCDIAKIRLGKRLGRREEELERIAFGLLKGFYDVKEAYRKLYKLLPELRERS